MSYAVRNDGNGWRAVASADECTEYEYFSETEPELTIDEIRSQKWAGIKVERDRRAAQGGYRVGNNWFHSDQISRTQQLGLVLLGGNIPANLQWKTMDGTFVTMIQNLAQQILAAAATSDNALFSCAESHKSSMLESENPDSYDFSADWPVMYSEE